MSCFVKYGAQPPNGQQKPAKPGFWVPSATPPATTILGEPLGPKTELRLSPEQIIEAVGAGGLKLSPLVELPPYHYGAVFEPRAF